MENILPRGRRLATNPADPCGATGETVKRGRLAGPCPHGPTLRLATPEGRILAILLSALRVSAKSAPWGLRYCLLERIVGPRLSPSATRAADKGMVVATEGAVMFGRFPDVQIGGVSRAAKRQAHARQRFRQRDKVWLDAHALKAEERSRCGQSPGGGLDVIHNNQRAMFAGKGSCSPFRNSAEAAFSATFALPRVRSERQRARLSRWTGWPAFSR